MTVSQIMHTFCSRKSWNTRVTRITRRSWSTHHAHFSLLPYSYRWVTEKKGSELSVILHQTKWVSTCFRCSPYSIVLYYQGIQVAHLGQGYQGSQEGQEGQVVQTIQGYLGHQASLEYPVQANQGLLSHHSNQGNLYSQFKILTNADTNSSSYINQKISHSMYKGCPSLKPQDAYQDCPQVLEVPVVQVDQVNQNQGALEGQVHPVNQKDQNHL